MMTEITTFCPLFYPKMPTLRYKITVTKKSQKPVKYNNKVHHSTYNLKTLFYKLINSAALPYIMAPLIFLAMMYVEWLYLFL